MPNASTGVASNVSLSGAREAFAELAGVVGPGDLQLRDVRAVDLRRGSRSALPKTSPP